MALTAGEYTRGYGLRMAMGRDFLPSEGTPGNDHELIISHKLWQERYNSDRAIIGKTILVNDQPSVVVGVVAAGMGDRNGMEYIVPAAFQPVGGNRGQVGNVMGRLKPGVTLAQAQAELAVIDKQFVSMNTHEVPNDKWNISVEPLRNAYLSKKIARNLRNLFAAVGLVLLIACSNLANLLLARGASRQKEIAVRAALGASRQRVFRQLIAESLLLSTAGGAGGILLGWAMMKIALLLLPSDFSLQAEVPIAMNVPVMCFAVAAALFSGVLSGCIPAWHSAKLNLSEVLKQGSRSVTGRGRRRTQSLLVIAEFALALTLLSGAGMVLQSFWNLTHIDIGARTDHILTAWIQAPKSDPWNPDRSKADLHTMMEKIATVPGVMHVALASAVPMQGLDAHHISIAGGPENRNESQVADFEIVTPSYFETFGVQLLKGRLLNDADRAGSPRAIVVSESFVNRYLQGVDPLEQRLLLPLNSPGEKGKAQTSWQIVGVFRDVLNSEHLVDKASPEMFVPLWQSPFGWAGELAVHTSSEPGTVTRSIRAAVTKALPG
jgi:putative ABC transport system permease protein